MPTANSGINTCLNRIEAGKTTLLRRRIPNDWRVPQIKLSKKTASPAHQTAESELKLPPIPSPLCVILGIEPRILHTVDQSFLCPPTPRTAVKLSLLNAGKCTCGDAF